MQQALPGAITTVEHRKPEGVKLYYTSEVDDCYELSTDGATCVPDNSSTSLPMQRNTPHKAKSACTALSQRIPDTSPSPSPTTGTGIPPEYSETIFERFEKADNFGQGTGLGLNICRLIAERLKGKVLLDKEYKEGARFVFVLPVKKSI